MSDPIAAALELRNSLGWIEPENYSLDEVANSLGILIKEVPTTGADGRILIKENSAIVTLNSEITHEGRRNFTIAHEIGHFMLHKNLSVLYSDTHKTLSEWYKTGPHEMQANQFAAELLMPQHQFKSKVKGRKLNIALIEELRRYFKVSLTAAFLRYVKIGEYPSMIVFMEDNVIKWKQFSHDFPFKWLPLGSKVPPLTVAGDYYNHNRLETKPEQIDAIEWFPDDYQLRHDPKQKLWEQSYKISDTALVSCIWTF